MSPFHAIFLDYGGFGIILLGVLSLIAFTQSETKDDPQRWAKALSKGWLMKSAVGIALLSWVVSFGFLYSGVAYLHGSGSLPQLSTILLCLILVMAGVAWWAISRPLPKLQPWLTQGLAVALIVSASNLLVESPKGILSQKTTDDDERRPAVAFVQERLASLGCFKAVGVRKWSEGSFDAFTALAVISFQSANDLLDDPRVNPPGEIGRPEFRLLARPFIGPKRCPPPEVSGNHHP